jgi:Spy/CpxP family protein refolding chaperone
MKKRIIIPTVLCGIVLTTSAIASQFSAKDIGEGDYQHGWRGPQMKQELTQEQYDVRLSKQLDRMTVLLDLNEEQLTQLKNLFEQQWQMRKELQEKMQASRDAMLAYRLNNKSDLDEFRNLVEEQAEIDVEMKVNREKQRQNLFSLLTEDQQAKLERLHEIIRGPHKHHQARQDNSAIRNKDNGHMPFIPAAE